MRAVHLILLSILAFAGCNSEKEPTYTKTVIDPRVLTNFSYKPGSYWVYKDSATGGLAELRITDATQAVVRSEPIGEIIDREVMYCNGRILHPVLSGADTTPVTFELSNAAVVLYYKGGLANKAPLFWNIYSYPVKTAPNYYNNFLWNNFIPSMVVNGHTYSNVLYSSQPNHDEYWVTETEGIVRMRLRHPYETAPDRVYELDHFHIEH